MPLDLIEHQLQLSSLLQLLYLLKQIYNAIYRCVHVSPNVEQSNKLWNPPIVKLPLKIVGSYTSARKKGRSRRVLEARFFLALVSNLIFLHIFCVLVRRSLLFRTSAQKVCKKYNNTWITITIPKVRIMKRKTQDWPIRDMVYLLRAK